MSSDIDCFFFPELTFRSWFLLFCSVFKDLFFAPFRVPDYITTTRWSLQAFFQALFYQFRSPLAPVYISKYPPSMSNTFFTFFIFFIKQKKDDRFESIIVHLVVFLVITKTIQAMPFPRYTTPIDLNHFDT